MDGARCVARRPREGLLEKRRRCRDLRLRLPGPARMPCLSCEQTPKPPPLYKTPLRLYLHLQRQKECPGPSPSRFPLPRGRLERASIHRSRRCLEPRSVWRRLNFARLKLTLLLQILPRAFGLSPTAFLDCLQLSKSSTCSYQSSLDSEFGTLHYQATETSRCRCYRSVTGGQLRLALKWGVGECRRLWSS